MFSPLSLPQNVMIKYQFTIAYIGFYNEFIIPYYMKSSSKYFPNGPLPSLTLQPSTLMFSEL